MSKKGGGGSNAAKAVNGITGNTVLDPAAMGKNGKGFGETMGEAALIGLTLTFAAGFMFGVKKFACGLLGIPFGDEQDSSKPASNNVPESDIRKYVEMNLEDDTTTADIKSIIGTIIQHNPELKGDNRVGKITAEMVKAHAAK